MKIAAQLAVEPTEAIKRVEARRLDRSEQTAIVRGPRGLGARGPRRLSVHRGRLAVDGLRLAVIIGTGIGGALTLLGQDDILEKQGLRKVSVLTIPMLMPNGPAAHVGLELGARPACTRPCRRCASGAEAIAWAWRMIQAGEVDVVVAGGTEACITRITIAGFTQARDGARATTSPSVPRAPSTPAATASCSARAPASRARARGVRAGPRGHGVRPHRRHRHHLRRVPHHRAGPDGRGRSRAIGARAAQRRSRPVDSAT